MKKLMPTLLSTLAAWALALAGTGAHAAGFQHGFAADPDGKPLEVSIWYPSPAAPKPCDPGPDHDERRGQRSAGRSRALPLVVISHGTGGSFLGHFDTATALADAGFVVAAVTHRGDNYADDSRSVFIMDRPRQISRVIDHMLSAWEGSAAIDPARIGMFGFSAGGFTTLASIGGIPDFSKVGPMCRDNPGDFACQLIAKSGQVTAPPDAGSVQDRRIKAAVVAAPALGFTFAPDGLKNVTVPVQLWRAENDTILPHPRYVEAGATGLARAAGIPRGAQGGAFRLPGAVQQRTGSDRAAHLHQCARLRPGGVPQDLRRRGGRLLRQDPAGALSGRGRLRAAKASRRPLTDCAPIGPLDQRNESDPR